MVSAPMLAARLTAPLDDSSTDIPDVSMEVRSVDDSPVKEVSTPHNDAVPLSLTTADKTPVPFTIAVASDGSAMPFRIISTAGDDVKNNVIPLKITAAPAAVDDDDDDGGGGDDGGGDGTDIPEDLTSENNSQQSISTSSDNEMLQNNRTSIRGANQYHHKHSIIPLKISAVADEDTDNAVPLNLTKSRTRVDSDGDTNNT